MYNAKIRIVHINEEEKLDDLQEYNLMVLKSYLFDYEHSFHWMPEYAKKTIEIKAQKGKRYFLNKAAVHGKS